MNNKLVESVPFSFDELYNNILNRFKNNGHVIDEGSNIAMISNAMAYVVSMLNMNTALNVNENILTLARRRDNVLKNARVLGYESTKISSYQYKIKLKLSQGNHFIPRYTKFSCNGNSYYYLGQNINLYDIKEGAEIEIIIKEGELKRYIDYEEDLTTYIEVYENNNGIKHAKQFIDIPFENIEDNGIFCYVSYYDDSATYIEKENWEQVNSSNTFEANFVLKKQFIRMDDINSGFGRIYFKLGEFGEGIKMDSRVDIDILISKGASGKIENVLETELLTHQLKGVEVTKIELLTSGSFSENIDKIKYNAPLIYNAANRAVVGTDYISITNSHNFVKDCIVWGGQEEIPKAPGNIWFSILPNSTNRTFDNNETKYFLLNSSSDWDYNIKDKILENGELIDNIEYLEQLNNLKKYLQNWFIQKTELISSNINNYEGVFDIFNDKKIPTLFYHHTNPIYLDFYYDIQLIRPSYNLSRDEIYKDIFNIINDEFNISENKNKALENFNVTYYNSNLIKYIDRKFLDINGIDLKVKTKFNLSLVNITTEFTDFNDTHLYKSLKIPLNLPFEKLYDEFYYLIKENIPDIYTENFIEEYDESTIYLEWGDIFEEDVLQKAVINIPIRLKIKQSGLIRDNIVSFNNIDCTNTKFKIYKNNTLLQNSDFKFTENENEILLDNIIQTDIFHVECDDVVGNYQILNGVERYILIEFKFYGEDKLFDELGLNENIVKINYLTVNDKYNKKPTEGPDDEEDMYYITEKGYILTKKADVDYITGKIIKTVRKTDYENFNILKIKHFYKNRFLNLKYRFDSFKTNKNIIPRLNTVNFLTNTY